MHTPPLPDPELLREVCRMKMPFGKYEGFPLVRLPEAYLAWLARKGMPSGRLGMLLDTALVIRQNGLDALVAPLVEDGWRGPPR
jgi:uncharacterized protein (DUF3820 family)